MDARAGHHNLRLTLRLPVATLLAAALALLAPVDAQQIARSEGPEAAYYVYVAGESEDRVDLVRWGPEGLEHLEAVPVGRFPTEIDGPHGLAVAEDGSRWFVSLAHGNPFGAVVAYDAATNRRVGAVELGFFPATLDVSAMGLLFAVNFNLHGDHRPSSVSVVDTRSLRELARIPTCTMPHGSRLTPDGRRHFSVCMMDDQLVEIDATRLAVTRRFSLRPGAEGPLSDRQEPPGAPACSPTWAHPAPEGARVYVACNKLDQVLEVDLEAGRVSRRFSTGRAGPYNLDVTADGRLLVVTYKSGDAVGIWDLEEGAEVAVIPTTRRLPHGIALAPDGRYAFVSVEGVGGEPGALEVIDLMARERVAVVDVGRQAGGVALWRVEGPAEIGR